MSFMAEFNALPLPALVARSQSAGLAAVRESFNRSQLSLQDFAHLISPAGSELLESMAQRSQAMTQRRFGKVIRLFAPLYVSNECVNSCRYCGFSRGNPILRVTLSSEEILREAQAIHELGFRNLLLVAGEHPKFVSVPYLVDAVCRLHPMFPGLSMEIAPLEVEEYRSIVQAGAEGLVIYQETYHPRSYEEMHPAGPKKDFPWRLETPERAYAAGFRRIGISPLYGLYDWRWEAICVAAHARYLLRHCWKAQITISLPRLRPSAGQFQPLSIMSDREMAQLVCAFRLMFPDVGLVLSTRESPQMRDALIPLGITMISAGSHTEPGGYTGAGRENLHRTEHGHIVDLASGASESAANSKPDANATVQFKIADERSPIEVAELIRRLGYEPVWKDWDTALTA
jgi:2-iminoacetate synthase